MLSCQSAACQRLDQVVAQRFVPATQGHSRAVQDGVQHGPGRSVYRDVLAFAQATGRRRDFGLPAFLGYAAEPPNSRYGLASAQPAVEGRYLELDQRLDTDDLRAALLPVGRRTRVNCVKIMQLHSGQIGYRWLDVARDCQVDEQQRTATAPAHCVCRLDQGHDCSRR